MSKPTTIDDFSFLSDEDVKLLYDIITTAEASSARPFQALFAAYDQVLAKYGIPKDHDQIYFRFLLHMGEGRREGEGLFERFESLLEKLGLQIAFVEEGEDKSRNDEEQNFRGVIGQTYGGSDNEELRKSLRRASFDSAYDVNAEARRVNGISAAPPAQRPHSTDVIHTGSFKQPRLSNESIAPVRHRRAAQRPNGAIRTTIRGRLKSMENPRTARAQSFRQITVSTSRERLYFQNERRLGKSKSSSIKSASAESEDSEEETASNLDTNVDAQLELFPKPRSAGPDLDQMDSHAKMLRYHHLAANAVLIFRSWKNRAIQSLNDHGKLLELATTRDADTLKRQVFDQWHLTFLQIRNIKETERFFESLEVKATKARNLFLLTKAFTHWAQSTSDEVSRKTAARRHILQTRYFNAWREVTVVNELKIRRQSLHKVMLIWKRRTASIIQNQETAMFFRGRNSVNGAYRLWFWHFCESRAPIWFATKLKNTFFIKWIESTRQTQIWNNSAIDIHVSGLLRNPVRLWTQRSGIVERGQNEAELFRRRKLLLACTKMLRTKLLHTPLETQMAHAIDFRVTRSALCIWVNRLRVLYEANRLNVSRTKRNAWTLWNDRLRCQALLHKIDDRLVLQALYRWVVQERLNLYVRIRQARIKKSFFSRWRDNMNKLCTCLGHAKYQVKQSRDHRLCTSIMTTWVVSTRAAQQQKTVAQDFFKSHALGQATGLWVSKLRNVQQLQDWSKGAQFYILASAIVKRWQAATLTQKRTKRREAFSKLRRENRLALTRKCFNRWLDASSTSFVQERKATVFNQDRIMRKGAILLNTWHTRAKLLEQFQPRAEALYNDHNSRSQFALLLIRYSNLQNSSLRAASFLAVSTDSAAASCLRKLNWHVFQLKRQDETAESLGERNHRKHCRNMIRYWADRTKQRRQQTERVLFQPSSSKYSTPTAATYQQLQSLENLDNTYPAAASSAQIPATPGYLRTPLRHRPTTAKTIIATTTKTNKASRFRPPPPPSLSSSALPQYLRDAHAIVTPATVQSTPFLARLRAVQGSRLGQGPGRGFFPSSAYDGGGDGDAVSAGAGSRFQRLPDEGGFGRGPPSEVLPTGVEELEAALVADNGGAVEEEGRESVNAPASPFGSLKG